MSVQAALAFTRAIRVDPALRAAVESLGPDATLDEVAAAATAAGFDCTAADLRSAHARDWQMRWLVHRRGAPPR